MISRDQVTLPHPVARSAAGRRPANVLRVAQNLSIAVAALMAIASVLGLFASGTYHDNDWARSGFRGNDLVSLALAVPLVLGSLVLARRGSVKAHVVWLGTLAYTLYNYLFYLFGAAFNDLFLVYVGLVALSVWALVLGLISTNPGRVRDELAPDRPSPVGGRQHAADRALPGYRMDRAIAHLRRERKAAAEHRRLRHPHQHRVRTRLVVHCPRDGRRGVDILVAECVGRDAGGDPGGQGSGLHDRPDLDVFFAAESDIDGAWMFIPVWLAMSIVSLISCGLLFGAPHGNER